MKMIKAFLYGIEIAEMISYIGDAAVLRLKGEEFATAALQSEIVMEEA